jgi:hypothetical protein
MVVLFAASLSGAALNAVGPINPNNGFPVWYQDSNALAFELCIPNFDELAAGACLLLPADVPDPATSISFPANFPDEAFWWAADTSIVLPLGGSADLVLALEAAFNLGPPLPGDQITFGRMRLRIDAPSDGLFTVTTPYGVRTFFVEAGGTRTINYTEDIGIGAPGDFSGALNSSIGPFLRASATAGGPPLPFVELFPGSGKFYVADPNFPTAVTGGPFGNVFRVDGPNIGGLGVDSIETDQFNLMGRRFNGVLPTPLTVTRTSFVRTLAGDVDIFATSLPNAVLRVSGGPNLQVGSLLLTGDGAGNFFRRIHRPDASTLPPIVTVTARATGSSLTTINSSLVDVVTIKKAEYNVAAQTLTIEASSGDNAATLPTLTATGFGDLTGGVLIASGVAVPPAFVTVESSSGGSDTEPVNIASYLIRGVIRLQSELGSLPVEGATVTLSGAASGVALTGADGIYTFTGLTAGNYTVTPSMNGFRFDPLNKAVTIVDGNVIGQNFTRLGWTVAGFVRTGTGDPISGVAVDLSGDTTAATVTDITGHYIFRGISDGSTVTITPTQLGLVFTPLNRTVTISGAHIGGLNFAGN